MALYVWLYLTIIVGYLFYRSIIYQKRIKEYEEQIMKMMDRRSELFEDEYKRIKGNIKKMDEECKSIHPAQL